MRAELWVFAITILLLINIYTDGYYWKWLKNHYDIKYYRMSIVIVASILFYYLFIKAPLTLWVYIVRALSWIQDLPVRGTNGNSSSIYRKEKTSRSVFDLTGSTQYALDSANTFNGSSNIQIQPLLKNTTTPTIPINSSYKNTTISSAEKRLLESGKEATGKRSVSETKKKYVAASQKWKCASCGNMLSAWFEVDHIQRVEHGGTNNHNNLVALCRECHGRKTSFENL